jgi:uncharacterized protein YcbK (DUF882 family)
MPTNRLTYIRVLAAALFLAAGGTAYARKGSFSGYGVGGNDLRQEPLPRPSGKLSIKNAFAEELEVNIFKADGSFDQSALAKLDHMFRCRSTGEERAMDPRLYEVLSLVYDHFGQKKIEINSGFRYQRNEGSRHFHGSAMDITVEGVNYSDVYSYANTLDPGGMGIGQYPRGGFVHIDFRAPGEPSYRWTDTHGSDGPADPGKAPDKMWQEQRSKKPNS